MDWSLIIAIIALVSSVLSPVLTAALTLHFQWKSRRLDELKLHESRRVSAIEAFLKTSGAMLYGREDEWRRAYGEAFASVLLYLPSTYHDDVVILDGLISARETDDARKRLLSLSARLSKDFPRLKEDCSNEYMSKYIHRVRNKSSD